VTSASQAYFETSNNKFPTVPVNVKETEPQLWYTQPSYAWLSSTETSSAPCRSSTETGGAGRY